MEDVLDLYAEEPDPKRPLVCFDEKPFQIVAEVRTPILAEPGRPQKVDCEYKRMGTCNLFMNVAPYLGWRHVEVTDHRGKGEFAWQMKALVDTHFPEAEVIRVVLDNLNTHTPGSLYEEFSPKEARRILKKLEFHHTPKHGSWLNMAEIELSVLSGQCLDRRFPDRLSVDRSIGVWEEERNRKESKIAWNFKVSDARLKLKRLYPV